MARRPRGVRWRIAWLAALSLSCAMALAGTASAQSRGRNRTKPKPKPKPAASQQADGAGKDKVKVFDFTGLDIAGQLRTPQLLYFLDRANEELERASLERRSFIPEMVRSIDEETL